VNEAEIQYRGTWGPVIEHFDRMMSAHEMRETAAMARFQESLEAKHAQNQTAHESIRSEIAAMREERAFQRGMISGIKQMVVLLSGAISLAISLGGLVLSKIWPVG